MSPRAFTPAELYEGTEPAPRPRVRLGSPAWISVGAALALSILGVVAISTTEPGLAARQAVYLVVGVAAAALATLAALSVLTLVLPNFTISVP